MDRGICTRYCLAATSNLSVERIMVCSHVIHTHHLICSCMTYILSSTVAPFGNKVFSMYSHNTAVFYNTVVFITKGCLAVSKNFNFNTAVFGKPQYFLCIKKRTSDLFLKNREAEKKGLTTTRSSAAPRWWRKERSTAPSMCSFTIRWFTRNAVPWMIFFVYTSHPLGCHARWWLGYPAS